MRSNICVIVAIFRPRPEHLDELFRSIASQTLRADMIVAVIADCISAQITKTTAMAHGLTLHLVEPADSLNAVRAFEVGLAEGLALCPTDTYFALCDQDDIWHETKLNIGARALDADPDRLLVHSDARLVDKDGNLIARSMFAMERRLRAPRLRDLLYRNTVTGMTTLMRRRLVELALPFPRQSGVHFYHDLWLALLAEATGKLYLIPEALVDYRQHDGNVMGVVDRRKQFTARGLPDMTWLRREAAGYALARFLGRSVYARVAAAGAGTGFAKGKAKLLRPYLARMRGGGGHLWDMIRFLARGNLGLARLAFGQAATSIGRVVWALQRTMTTGLSESFNHFDDRLFSLSPGVAPEPLYPDSQRVGRSRPAKDLIDQRKVLRWKPRFDATQPSLTILVPSLNPPEVFAGIATAVDIGIGIAARGQSVRFIATDLPIAGHSVSRNFILARLSEQQSSSGAADRITLHCGVTEGEIPAHNEDRFLATAWWSAFLSQTLIHRFDFVHPRFLYLIQDFEPNFYPWGAEFADAMASYDMDFVPIFNTTLLRDYFKAQGFAFAETNPLVFRPSIDVARYSAGTRQARGENARQIALYGRPEVARNMFPTAIEALSRFVEKRGFGPKDVIIKSVGLAHETIELGNGLKIISQGKLPYSEYPDFLLRTDIGLSLMLSPHPSHPPLEMAASGVRVVTNSFATKNLSDLSPAILSSPPDAAALVKALDRAWDLPPPSDADRQINLALLGPTLNEMMDEMSANLWPTGKVNGQLRRVILHIGAPKCGSTFLQRVLLANQDRLARAGIVYPHQNGDHPGNAPKLEELTASKMLEDLGDAQTVIYSHEDLLVFREHSQTFAQAASEAGLDVQVVCFLRPFHQLIFGTYSQTLKQNFEEFAAEGSAYGGRTFDEFCRHIHARFRFDQFLKKWEATFPNGRLLLRSHTLIRPTFEALLNGVELDWNVDPSLTNPSLRIEDCEQIAKAINEGHQDIDALRDALRAAYRKIGLADPGRSAERISMIEALFAESTQILERDFGFAMPDTAGTPASDPQVTTASQALTP